MNEVHSKPMTAKKLGRILKKYGVIEKLPEFIGGNSESE